MSNKKGDLRVWWIPQIPCEQFNVPVASIAEAKLVLRTLGNYDLFQLENNIKPDYCNAGGLCVYDPELCDEDDGDGWSDWYDDEGRDIDDLMSEDAA